jgi:hypothetical protein
MAQDCLSIRPASVRTERPRRHGQQLGRAQAWATGHQTRWGLILHDLEEQGNPFCKLTVKETVNGEKAAVARFSRRLATMRAASGGAPTSRSSSTTSPCSPQAPPWVNCFRRWWIELERWLSLCSRVWACRTKSDEYGPLFIGFLGPTQSGDGVLRFLCTNQTLSRLRLGDFWKGMSSGWLRYWNLNSQPG